MNPDQPSPEADLRGLQATPLDDDFLRRLEACADGTWTQLTQEELRFENLLRKAEPVRMEASLLADLEKIVQGVPFAMDEKIVLFPKASQSQAQPERKKRPVWAAAAAVALIGGLSAMLVPVSGPAGNGGYAETKTPATTGADALSSPDLAPAPANYAPASFNSGVSEVHDEGVVWNSNKPHTLLRVVYKDKVTVTGKDGKVYEVERPRVGYVTVPAKAD